MVKLRTKIFLYFAAAASLLCSRGECFDYDFCDPCWFNGTFYGTVEGLYWTPSHCPLFIARKSSPSGATFEGARDDIYLDTDYHGGVRGRVGYEVCGYFADVAYLHYNSEDHETQERGAFSAMQPAGGRQSQGTNISFIDATGKFRYRNVDFRFGHHFCLDNCLTPFLYLHARWIKLEFEEELNALDTDFSSFQESIFNGGAFGIGIGSRRTFCGCFGIGTTFAFMAAIGETTIEYTQTEEQINLETIFLGKDKWCHTLPGFEFRLGLDYSCCIYNCIQLTAEVGYELDWYSQILYYYSENLISGGPGSDRVPLMLCQDLSFSGPFFRLTAFF